MIEYVDHVPIGWAVIEHTNTQPVGYKWINNRKSRFSKEYKHALVPEGVIDGNYNREQGDSEEAE